MSQPKRIQRRRVKGWRMPEGAIYVGRPTQWGNPWLVDVAYYGSLEAARFCTVALYQQWLTGLYNSTTMPPVPNLEPLRGKDLACWCPLDQPCHADVLLELANVAERTEGEGQ